MDNSQKKKLIAILLGISCLICIVLLGTEKEEGSTISPAAVDSLLLKELSAFNIPSEKYQWTRIDVDSSFHRKNYRVKLPLGVSRTWFHSELSRSLHDVNMKTWAKVNVPESTMKIHVISENTILRSVSVETDTTYYRHLYPAIVMIYFDQPPHKNLLDKIESLGEPISLVLRVRSAAQAESWTERLEETNHSYYYWMTDDEYFPGADFNEGRFLQRSQDLAEVSSRPGLLFFQQASTQPSEEFFRELAEKDISLIQTRNAAIISSVNGRQEFYEDFGVFLKKAQRGQHPVALIQASEESLEWISENLLELKKGGVLLSRPDLIEGLD